MFKLVYLNDLALSTVRKMKQIKVFCRDPAAGIGTQGWCPDLTNPLGHFTIKVPLITFIHLKCIQLNPGTVSERLTFSKIIGYKDFNFTSLIKP